MAEVIFIPFTVGGGIRTLAEIRKILLAGADKVSINTAAVRRPALIAEASRRFGSQCVVVAIDARGSGSFVPARRQRGTKVPDPFVHWEVYIHGGRTPTGLDAVAWARKAARLGAGEILLTSMDRDGTKDGYDLELTRAVSDAVPVPVIASGGAGTLRHLAEAIRRGGADAVLAASIFHYGEFTVPQAKRYLRRRGVPVRL